jgi:hypothetical protein
MVLRCKRLPKHVELIRVQGWYRETGAAGHLGLVPKNDAKLFGNVGPSPTPLGEQRNGAGEIFGGKNTARCGFLSVA